MDNGYIPRLSLDSNPFQKTNMNMIPNVDMSGVVHRSNLDSMNPNSTSFKSVMTDTLKSLNAQASEPDKLMNQAMVSGNVDVHDIMIANAKAELAVTIAAQMTTKVVQAYDRILQIQI